MREECPSPLFFPQANRHVVSRMEDKTRSLAFLSLLCFGLADVRDGLGPFLGVYLQHHGWTADAIGSIMSLGDAVALLCAAPLGALTDHTRAKRALLACATVLTTLACGAFFLSTAPLAAGVSRCVQAVAGAAIGPLISGVTLGLVGQAGYPARLGVTEAWNHAGNATSAALGGLVGFHYGLTGVFWVMAGMAAISLVAIPGINGKHIDHQAARGLDSAVSQPLSPPPGSFPPRSLWAVALTVTLFHFGNAAMLPLLGQSAVTRFGSNPALYTAATVIVAQGSMIATALLASRLAVRKGYGILFLFSLCVLPIRGLIAGLYASEWVILPVQILDGLANGTLGVAMPGLVARLLQGTGHINLGLGFVTVSLGTGASMSHAYAGHIAHLFSYEMAFFALALAPFCGLILYIASLRRFPDLYRASQEGTP